MRSFGYAQDDKMGYAIVGRGACSRKKSPSPKTEKGKYAHLCNYAFWKLNKMLKYSFTPSETVI